MQLAENLESAITPVSNLRFLEYSIPVDNVLQSLEFFRTLGFSSLLTNDIRSYAYGVITDGRCFLGLHQRDEFSQLTQQPRFCFVHDEIAPIVRYLNDRNYQIIDSQLDEDSFQQAIFHGPNHSVINVLAARSFSLPAKDDCKDSLLGHFSGFTIPTSNLEASSKFWEGLELLVMPILDEQAISVSANRLNMLLVENTTHRLPGLLFEHTAPETLFPLFASLGLTLDVSEEGLLLESEYRFKTSDDLYVWVKRLE